MSVKHAPLSNKSSILFSPTVRECGWYCGQSHKLIHDVFDSLSRYQGVCMSMGTTLRDLRAYTFPTTEHPKYTDVRLGAVGLCQQHGVGVAVALPSPDRESAANIPD